MQIEQSFFKQMETSMIWYQAQKLGRLQHYWLALKRIFCLTFFLDSHTNTEAVLREATLKIHAKYDFFETTLQIEVYDDEMEDCKKCSDP